MKEGFLRTDESYLADVGDAGSTALVAMVRDKQIVVANAGDCRALLLQRSTRAASRPYHVVALSVDHKPDREDEEARIKAAGGFVSPAGQEGCARVDGHPREGGRPS